MTAADSPASSLPDAVLQLMGQHRSVRSFTDEAVDSALVERAVSAAQQAATSSWIQGYHLLEVSRGARRDEIARLAGGQAQVQSAPLFFIVCGDTRRHRLAAKLHGQPHVECTETFVLATIDASLFAQNLTLALEAHGLGTCYIGGIRNDLPGLDALLDVPSGTFPLFGLAVGWPGGEAKAQVGSDAGRRPRFEPGDIWTQEAFPTDDEVEGTIRRFDGVATRYYAERGAEGRDWSGGLWRKFKTALRPGLKAYYESKGASLR